MRIRPSREEERDLLLELWMRSVRATHDFVTEDHLQSMVPIVRNAALVKLRVWSLVDSADRPIGFMGMDGNSVEMLFIDPDHLRRGCGTMLLDFAQSMHPVVRLDVNEQNKSARAFYESQGFVITGRSNTDAQGNPFPMLHLARSADDRQIKE